MRAQRLALVAVVLSALVAGCGASALQQHSVVAQGWDDVSQLGRELVLDARADELRAAGRHAQEYGEDVEHAVRARAEAFDAGPVLGSYNAFVNAKNVYVRGLLLAAQERRPSLVHLIPVAAEVLRVYQAFRLALGERGERLPAAPSFVGGLR